MSSSPKQSSDYFLALAAGFFATVFAGLAVPVFALVDLAAPAVALVDFAAAAGLAAAGFALVDFAAATGLAVSVFAIVDFAGVLFAAIPIFLHGNSSTEFKLQDVRRYQSRTTAETDCGGAKKTCL